jgi:CBS domain-containing protein
MFKDVFPFDAWGLASAQSARTRLVPAPAKAPAPVADLPQSRTSPLKIETVMSRYVEFAAPGDTAAALAVMMGELDVGAVPVGTEDDILGVVTDRDILYRVVAKGLDPAGVTARDILSAPVLACRPEDSLEDATELMAANRVRRLAVTAEGGRVVGWVTLADLSRPLLLESGTVRQALGELSRESAG